MSEADISRLIEVILTTNNNEQRKQSEASLNEIKTANPATYIRILVSLMKSFPDKKVRSFAVIGLRKDLSKFTQQSYVNFWPNLDASTQALVKSTLLSSIETETDISIRHQICDTIGELGGSLMDDEEKNEWPELIGIIMHLIMSTDENFIESGLKILASLIPYTSQHFINYANDLYVIFKSGIENKNPSIRLAAIEGFVAFMDIIESSLTKKFEEIIPSMLAAVEHLLATDPANKGEKALGYCVDLAEAEPKLFRKSFQATYESMLKISITKTLEGGVRRQATETLLLIIERLPKLISGQKDKLIQMIEMIFLHMIDIDNEIEHDWESPAEGYNEDFEEDDDFEVVRFGMNSIDRMISAISEKEMIPLLSQIVQKMFAQPDWRYSHAALLALSQVGEYIEDAKEVQPIVDLVCSYLTNPNSKIRYAVCHCLGQIADDMQPDFQKQFHEKVMTALINTLYDPVPRVVSHACAAITNFVEGMENDILDPYLGRIFEKCFELVQNGISIVKENAVSAIAATAETAGEAFKPFYDNSVPILFTILNNYNSKPYRQLRGQVLECLTLMAHAAGKELFAKHANQLIGIMLAIQQTELDPTDPQKSYLLSGWQRLCLVLGDDFQPFLPQIVPSLYKLMKQIFNEQSQAGTTDKTEDLNTVDTEEAEVAIQMLNVLIDENKDYFVSNHMEQTIQLILPLCNFSSNENIRKSAARCLPVLIEGIKARDPVAAQNYTRGFITVMFECANTEYDPDVLIPQIQVIRDCIDECNRFLTQEEVDGISEKIIKLLLDSDQRKTENEKYKKQEDIDEDEVDLINDDVDNEEELHVALAELIGILFKTHKELTLKLVDVLYQKVLVQVLQPTLSDKMHKFGLFLVDDMIEYLGIELIHDKWQILAEALVKYAVDKTCFVRQAAVYGIGLLAEKCQDLYAVISETVLKTLIAALKVPQGQEKNKIYQYCRENTVSALTKVIKHQANKINLPETVEFWLYQLPYRYDKEEAIKTHDFLLNLIIEQPGLVMGEGFKNLARVLKIFGTIIDTKTSNEEQKIKISKILKELVNNKAVLDRWQDLTKELDENERKRLESCLKL